MAVERSLILIKPDAVERKLAGEILARIERRGFTLRALALDDERQRRTGGDELDELAEERLPAVFCVMRLPEPAIDMDELAGA